MSRTTFGLQRTESNRNDQVFGPRVHLWRRLPGRFPQGAKHSGAGSGVLLGAEAWQPIGTKQQWPWWGYCCEKEEMLFILFQQTNKKRGLYLCLVSAILAGSIPLLWSGEVVTVRQEDKWLRKDINLWPYSFTHDYVWQLSNLGSKKSCQNQWSALNKTDTLVLFMGFQIMAAKGIHRKGRRKKEEIGIWIDIETHFSLSSTNCFEQGQK